MEAPGCGEADLVDRLTYQGLLWSQQRHTASDQAVTNRACRDGKPTMAATNPHRPLQRRAGSGGLHDYCPVARRLNLKVVVSWRILQAHGDPGRRAARVTNVGDVFIIGTRIAWAA